MKANERHSGATRPRTGPLRPDLNDLIKRSIKTGCHRDPAFVQLLAFCSANDNDTQARDFALEILTQKEMQDLCSPDPNRATNPASPEDLTGTITLGIIDHTGVPWQITPEMLTNHMAILGRSGGGKTNLILLILVQLLEMRRA